MTSIRRGQLITTQGIGSIVTDKDNETYLILTCDSWRYVKRSDYIVDEPRLKRYLGVKTLLQPPAADKQRGAYLGANEFVTTIRFPSWHVCPKKGCHTLQKIDFEQKIGACINPECNDKSYKSKLIPVRFLSVCENGHIHDFPFQEWVHRGKPFEGHVLQYQEWADRTGLAGILIKCKTCEASSFMSGALSPDALKNIKSCSGHRPWLYKGKGRREIDESCDKALQGVQRAASNVYLPVIRNSIFIPTQDDMPAGIANFLKNNRYVNLIKDNADEEQALKFIKGLSEFNDEDAKIVYGLIHQKEEAIEYNDIKEEEFRVFKKGSIKRDQDLDCTPQDMSSYQSWFRNFFSAVSLVEKLRDTRAYVGFTRVKPYDELTRTIQELIKQISPSGELPVDVVRGEGIFIEFDSAAIDRWKAMPGVQERLQKLTEKPTMQLERNYKDPAVFVLLHTFSHILINELCLVSGYNNSSIKERIYATSFNGNPMHGVLLYTNAGDSEGSLGGLVRNGKPGALEPLILSALQKADWCSSDPVCSEIIPQGFEGSNLAACHNCCLLPETACENMNLYLDRGLLRGSLSDGSFGYFNNLTV